MLVRLTKDRASMRSYFRAGETVNLPDKEARRLIKIGDAVLVRSSPVEMAVRTAPEKATRRPHSRTASKSQSA